MTKMRIVTSRQSRLESVNAVESVGNDEMNDSGEIEEWHEPMEDAGECVGAVGGVATEEVDAPNADDGSNDQFADIDRVVNRMVAKRIEWLDANASRLFAEYVVLLAMSVREDAPDEVLVESELRAKEEKKKKESK